MCPIEANILNDPVLVRVTGQSFPAFLIRVITQGVGFYFFCFEVSFLGFQFPEREAAESK